MNPTYAVLISIFIIHQIFAYRIPIEIVCKETGKCTIACSLDISGTWKLVIGNTAFQFSVVISNSVHGTSYHILFLFKPYYIILSG